MRSLVPRQMDDELLSDVSKARNDLGVSVSQLAEGVLWCRGKSLYLLCDRDLGFNLEWVSE